MERKIGSLEFVYKEEIGKHTVITVKRHPSNFAKFFGSKPVKELFRHTGDVFELSGKPIWYEEESGRKVGFFREENKALNAFLRTSNWEN